MTRRPASTRPVPSRAGFTFVEVLFAIIILGIGTIMLAGMLPVAIKQSSDTRNDITGKSVCESGLAYLKAVTSASQTGLPPTDTVTVAGMTTANVPGRIVPLNVSVVTANNAADKLGIHESLFGSRVLSSDQRFQWLAFYGREAGSGIAKVIVLALRLQNTDVVKAYGQATLSNEAVSSDNGPMLATAQIIDGGALEADRIEFANSSPAQAIDAGNAGAADTGAFVIVAASPNDTTGSGDTGRSARNNGRVFRLGARRIDLDDTGYTFDLQPGYDLAAAEPGPTGRADGSMNTLPTGNAAGGYPDGASSKVAGAAVQVWLVGRGLRDPSLPYSAGANPYTGPVQDISVLSTDLPLGQ